MSESVEPQMKRVPSHRAIAAGPRVWSQPTMLITCPRSLTGAGSARGRSVHSRDRHDLGDALNPKAPACAAEPAFR